MRTNLTSRTLWLCLALAGGATLPAQAGAISNGGFEAGFTGWSIADQAGSDGTFFQQSGTLSPLNGFPVPAPPQGTFAAMTDAGAGGSHVLYQDFVVPVFSGPATARFSLYVNNGAPDFYSPSSLDWAATNPTGAQNLNQQARVDIMTTSADPFSVAAGDVLQNLFQTNPGDPLESGYTAYNVDVTALLLARQGQTLRLRFAEVDNVLFLNLGVDNVDIETSTPVPEPTTWLLASGALLGLAICRLRRVR